MSSAAARRAARRSALVRPPAADSSSDGGGSATLSSEAQAPVGPVRFRIDDADLPYGVSVWVYAHEDTSYSVSGQSGFSCVRGETTEGFGADLASDQQVGVMGWTEVAEWEVSGTDGRAGLFSLGTGFDMSTGRYTASVEGVYFASAQVRLDGADTGRFEVLLG